MRAPSRSFELPAGWTASFEVSRTTRNFYEGVIQLRLHGVSKCALVIESQQTWDDAFQFAQARAALFIGRWEESLPA